MAGKDNNTSNRKLDLAARAAWLYYIRGRTQDEIATELNVSRQNAHHLFGSHHPHAINRLCGLRGDVRSNDGIGRGQQRAGGS